MNMNLYVSIARKNSTKFKINNQVREGANEQSPGRQCVLAHCRIIQRPGWLIWPRGVFNSRATQVAQCNFKSVCCFKTNSNLEVTPFPV